MESITIRDSGQIGGLLRKLRVKQGLSVQQIGGRMDVSVSAYNNYEHGRSVPTMAKLEKVLSAMGYGVEITVKRKEGRR